MNPVIPFIMAILLGTSPSAQPSNPTDPPIESRVRVIEAPVKVAPKPKVTPEERARHIVATRASSMVGKKYPMGWCQKWVRKKLLHKKGVGDFDHDLSADAEDGWKAAKKHHKAHKIHNINKIPVGALVYWRGGSNDNGHVAVSAGNGMIYSTDLPQYGKIGKVSIHLPHKRWHVKLLGYVILAPRGMK